METVMKIELQTAIMEPQVREIPLEATPLQVGYDKQNSVFVMWWLIDDEMPPIAQKFWLALDNMDLEEPVPEDEDWEVSVVGTVLLGAEATAYHIIQGASGG